MKPFYERAGCTLYLGDCLEILPTLESGSVEITVTSPPYNTLPQKYVPSGLHAERKTGVNKWIDKAVNNGYEDARPEPEYQEWVASIVSECLRCCCGLVWVNHKVRFRDGEAVHPVRFLQFPIYSEVIWNRSGSMALNCKRYAPSHEGIWGFGRPHVWNDELNKKLSVWSIPFDSDGNDHPCSFPPKIPERLISSSTQGGDTVLDPFAGSGTTGVACVQTGRKFIGIEIEPKYAEIAAKRIDKAINEVESEARFFGVKG